MGSESHESINRALRRRARRGVITPELPAPEPSGADLLNAEIRRVAGRGEPPAPTEPTSDEGGGGTPTGDADGGARGTYSPPAVTTNKRMNAWIRTGAGRDAGEVPIEEEE